VKLGTANIQNFPDHPAREVAQDASTVAASCSLAGLQEIQPHEDTPVVRGALGPDWWMVGGHREVPIIGRADRWELLDHYVVAFDRPHLPRPQNPHGGIVTAIVRSVKRPKLPAFAVVNTHLVAGGHNGPKNPLVAQRWEVEFKLLRAQVSGLHGSGFSVFVVGDLNDPRPPRLGPTFQWLSPQHSPDHLGQLVHSGGVQLVDPTHERVPLNSDHDCHVISGPLRHAD
jgi:hypothetical protein